MKRRIFISVCLGLFLASGWFVLGCASTPAFSRPVYADSNVMVRLESSLMVGTASDAPNSHPATLTEQALPSILRSVIVQKEIDFLHYYVLRQDPKPERVFLDDDIELLTPHLKAALAKARPEERIVFLLNRVRDGGISEITSGGLFVRRDKLYVLLANFRVPLTTQRKVERAKEFPLVPLEQPEFFFVASAHQSVLGAKDPSIAPNPTGSGGLLVALTAMPMTAPTPTELPAKVETPPSIAPKSAEPPKAEASSPPALEGKLRQLKAWREQGLITDPEYRDKLKKLLDAF